MLSVLPEEVKSAIHKEYSLRLFALSLFVLAMGVGSAAVSLMPAYIAARSEWQQLAGRAELLQKTAEGQQEMDQVVGTTKNLIALFVASDENVKVLPIFNAVMGALSPDIHMNGLGFNRAENAVRVEGVAETRSALVEFRNALQALPVFVDVHLPISELARGENIDFSLSAKLQEKSK